MSFAQIFALAASVKAEFIAGADLTKLNKANENKGGRPTFKLDSVAAGTTVEDVDSQIEEALLSEVQY